MPNNRKLTTHPFVELVVYFSFLIELNIPVVFIGNLLFVKISGAHRTTTRGLELPAFTLQAYNIGGEGVVLFGSVVGPVFVPYLYKFRRFQRFASGAEEYHSSFLSV